MRCSLSSTAVVVVEIGQAANCAGIELERCLVSVWCVMTMLLIRH